MFELEAFTAICRNALREKEFSFGSAGDCGRSSESTAADIEIPRRAQVGRYSTALPLRKFDDSQRTLGTWYVIVPA